MGRKKKSRQHSDFAPKKQTPGKVLKKTNVTNTTFKAKQLSLFLQLENHSTEPSRPGKSGGPKHSIHEICQNLCHYQESVLKRALECLLELHAKDVTSFHENLNKILPAVGRLLGMNIKFQDNFIFCLNKVFARIFASPEHYIIASFDRICSYIALGLTNMQDKMTTLALSILNKHIFPRKNAPMNREIFKSYLRLIACDCVVGKAKFDVMRSALCVLPNFLKMYVRHNNESTSNYVEAEIKNSEFRIIKKTPPNLHYYELSTDPSMQMDSPFMYPTATKKGLAMLGDACFVFLGRMLSIENFPLDNFLNRVVESLKHFNQILSGYVIEHGVRPGFFGERFAKLATDLNVMKPALQIPQLKTYMDQLQKI